MLVNECSPNRCYNGAPVSGMFSSVWNDNRWYVVMWYVVTTITYYIQVGARVHQY